MHRLAIYDLDRTITAVPTWTPFLLHAAWTRAPWRLAFVPVVIGAMLVYRAGLIERRTLKQLMHRLLVGTLTPDQSATLAQSFADSFARHIRSGARAQIAADRAAGYRIVVASAAHRFYAARIAAALGIDDVIATEAEIDARGRITPRIAGRNCYGPAKLAMIEAWMAREGLARADAHVRFYSDHVTDEPTFAWADEAIAVNPHAKLRTLAEARGWPIVDWR
ncbi:haloacid dehalogenase [Sphingomonas sp. Leaf33]|uniref:HAD family hydrolase n=1 Tax=Sphingomonas sp. Leaf33 TaxID=1736215 RepID=UPI0006FFF05C|nr:HAD-IB family hydrolase [Sphingomonas sp. Leaf33]KQN26680.1 haloacid dehalogenase [Sphingomonas sp. Leaf33]